MRGADKKPRIRKMTDERRASYYERVVYYRCALCSERWNIFTLEANVIGHLLTKHRLKLDEDNKISLLRKLYGKTHLTEKQCAEFGVDYNRVKRIRGESNE